jgi:hypothetical protein
MESIKFLAATAFLMASIGVATMPSIGNASDHSWRNISCSNISGSKMKRCKQKCDETSEIRTVIIPR